MDESQLNIAVSLALRGTEICSAAAEVWDESQVSTVEEPRDQRRVLAVVTHRHATDPASVAHGKEGLVHEREEGCLFIMKYKSPSSSELYPYRLIPIVPTITASLKQANDGTASLNASEFQLTLSIPEGVINFGSNQMHTLSAVLEELRRLKALAADSAHGPPPTPPSGPTLPERSDTVGPINDIEEAPADQREDLHERHWEWLHFYLSHKASRILPSQKPKPDDVLSILNGPKFSGSSAGLPVNEDGDIALIRDQWVRRQLMTLKSEYCQIGVIKLRIGTFNVNNKPPSQSLTSWLRPSSLDSSSDAARTSSDGVLPVQESNTFDSPKRVTPPVEIPSEQEMLPSVETETEIPIPDSLSVTESTVPSSVGLTSSEDHPTASTPPSSIPSENSEDLPDIFVLGFQELDLSAEALLYSTSTSKADTWIAALFEALGKHANKYTQLASKQLVGVLVVVIIRKEMQSTVKEVSTGSAGVGIMGFMGNKGATAVRLRLNSTTVTFVCSHLAASDDYAEKRNSDFIELSRKLRFPIAWKGSRSMRSITANIWETDVLFWLGDLNYRIDLPDEEVRKLLTSKPQCHENRTLLEYDQLKMAVHHKHAFANFIEHDITFLPTYRFNGELSMDELGYDLKRRPAWTDRILYLATDSSIVSQTCYQSHPEITFSDHRPVSADFNLQLETHDPHELHRVATSIFEKLGNFEDSEEAPIVSLLDGTEINLGQVSYLHPLSRTMRLKNEGKVACAFRFLPLDPGASISKEWLKVEPIYGILLVGETETITLTTNIDKRAASFMNHETTKLEDNLILHLSRGTDHVLTVSGSYQPTCFANSLAWLVRSPGPIREQGNTLLPDAHTLSAPRELMFLVEWLITNAQHITDLFMTPGDESLVTLIREHLDTKHLDSGESIVFPEGADHRAIALAFGEALLRFLDSLTEPMIPWVLYPRCALAVDREDVFEILDDVPGFARNVYVTITAFLHYIGQFGGPERPMELAKIFANILLRDDPRGPAGMPSLTPLGKRNFLLCTIS